MMEASRVAALELLHELSAVPCQVHQGSVCVPDAVGPVCLEQCALDLLQGGGAFPRVGC